MKPTFNPTSAQIEIAQDLFISMAFRDVIKPAFENIVKQILTAGNYHYRPEWLNDFKMKERGYVFPDDGCIRDVKETHMMDGLNEYCRDNTVDNDTARYYSELDRLTRSAKMVHGQNALAMAESDVIEYQHKLFEATHNIHGVDLDTLLSQPDNRKKMIELLLRLFAGSVENHMEPRKRKFFDQRINA